MMRGLRLVPPRLVLAIIQPAPAQTIGTSSIDAETFIPATQDAAWLGGTIRIDVDASDIVHRIVTVRQTIPLPPGAQPAPLVLLAPEWLPGHHAPRGEIEKLAGLTFTADGRTVPWRRDPVNVYAFHVAVPDGAKTMVADFQYLAATERDQGRIKIGATVMNLQWDNLSLYPAGYAARRIPVQARITFPAGWTDATALRGTRSGTTTSYTATDYETLMDSPVFAGRFTSSYDLGQGVRLNIIADSTTELAATPDQIARHRKLVAEAVALFGFRPFDHYDFLFGISEDMGRIGLEHQRSSENAVGPGYFTRWDNGPGDRNLLPHELVHSWNGKYRRPAGLVTPDYATPMRGDLLWVYEGQTQFWGHVLGARSGLSSKDQTLDALATIAARLDIARGRQWRPLADTTLDPVIAARRPKAWPDWQRSEDYYNEGLMIWLEADAIIRRGTGGKRGLDDFAHSFFAGRDGEWAVSPYTRADLIAALGQVMPYDWAGFFIQRVDTVQPDLSKAGLELGGYRLAYGTTPGAAVRERESDGKLLDQSYGVGLTVKDDGTITAVIWESAAFRAGLRDGDRIMAINGLEYQRARMVDALDGDPQVRGTARTDLIVKQARALRTISLDYSGGIRYPRLQKVGEGEGSLDRLLKPRL